VLGATQRRGGIACVLDAERSANELFAIAAGHVDESKLVLQEPRFIEEVVGKIVNITNRVREVKGPEVPVVFVWDSITVSMTEREFKELNLSDNYSEAEFKRVVGAHEQPGERAKACGKALRKLQAFLDENNTTLFIINQTRSKIGVLYGSPETTLCLPAANSKAC